MQKSLSAFLICINLLASVSCNHGNEEDANYKEMKTEPLFLKKLGKIALFGLVLQNIRFLKRPPFPGPFPGHFPGPFPGPFPGQFSGEFPGFIPHRFPPMGPTRFDQDYENQQVLGMPGMLPEDDSDNSYQPNSRPNRRVRLFWWELHNIGRRWIAKFWDFVA